MPRGVYLRKPRPPKIYINPVRLEEMIECGYTRLEAADEFGCGEKCVRDRAKEQLGMTFPRKGVVRPETRLGVIDAVKMGRNTCPEVAEHLGRCRAQVYVLVRELLKDGILERIKVAGGRMMHLRVAKSWEDKR